MPTLIAAYSAGEFLDEALLYDELPLDGYEIYNELSTHPYEWWILK